jgi:hypothetical protein
MDIEAENRPSSLLKITKTFSNSFIISMLESVGALPYGFRLDVMIAGCFGRGGMVWLVYGLLFSTVSTTPVIMVVSSYIINIIVALTVSYQLTQLPPVSIDVKLTIDGKFRTDN